MIKARLSGISGNTNILVTAAILQSISITPNSPSIAKGLTQQLTATGIYSNGTSQLLNGVTWSSSATAVATVNSTGLASSVSIGSAVISANFSGVSGSTTLTITDIELQSISISPSNKVINTGNSLQFTARGNYTDSTTKDLSGAVSWSSSSTSVASISVSGVAVGQVVGNSIITAQLGDIKGTTNLVVAKPPTLTFELLTTYVNFIQNYYTLRWSTTNATDCVASEDWSGSKGTWGDGNITPLSARTYNYILTCSGQGGSVTKTVSMKFTGVPSASISASVSGNTAYITWSSTNYATYCVGSDSLVSFGTMAAKGTSHLNVHKGTYTLGIVCKNTLGTGSKSTYSFTVP